MLPTLMTRDGSSCVPPASSSGRNALVRKNGAFRLRSTTLSQAAAGNSARGAPQVAPALLTRMFRACSRSPTSLARRRHSASADRSAGIAVTVPYRESSCAASAHASALRELMYTRAPASSRPRAIMSPIPRVPPVTTAVFPDRSNRFIGLSLPKPESCASTATEAARVPGTVAPVEDTEVIARRAGRVLVVDAAGRVLLLQGFDPAAPAEMFWFTIGGGADAGESLAEAAAR